MNKHRNAIEKQECLEFEGETESLSSQLNAYVHLCAVLGEMLHESGAPIKLFRETMEVAHIGLVKYANDPLPSVEVNLRHALEHYAKGLDCLDDETGKSNRAHAFVRLGLAVLALGR